MHHPILSQSLHGDHGMPPGLPWPRLASGSRRRDPGMAACRSVHPGPTSKHACHSSYVVEYIDLRCGGETALWLSALGGAIQSTAFLGPWLGNSRPGWCLTMAARGPVLPKPRPQIPLGVNAGADCTCRHIMSKLGIPSAVYNRFSHLAGGLWERILTDEVLKGGQALRLWPQVRWCPCASTTAHLWKRL